MEIERHRYSVPNALVGQSLDARLTRDCVELLHRGQRVAAHARSAHAGGFTTLDAHMSAAHLAHRDWTPQQLIDWGLSIGVATGGLIDKLLQRFKHPEHGYRSALGLLSLSKGSCPTLDLKEWDRRTHVASDEAPAPIVPLQACIAEFST